MAHSCADRTGRMRLRLGCKRVTYVLCAGNVVLALFMLHATLAPVCFDPPSSSSSSSAPLLSHEDHVSSDGLEVAPTKEELERIAASNQLRRALLPTTLIERVEEIRQETKEESNATETTNLASLKLNYDDDEHNATDVGVSDDGLNLSTMHDLKVDAEEDDTIPGRAVPPECHAEAHTDYGGAAVRWGPTYHVDSAADCCQACLDQARNAIADQKKCNIWVYCPRDGGCYSPDQYTHENHECWLKQADEPMLNFKGHYDEVYRRQHPTAPSVVPWVSGVV